MDEELHMQVFTTYGCACRALDRGVEREVVLLLAARSADFTYSRCSYKCATHQTFIFIG
jgi:hypothetical protein